MLRKMMTRLNFEMFHHQLQKKTGCLPIYKIIIFLPQKEMTFIIERGSRGTNSSYMTSISIGSKLLFEMLNKRSW